MIYETDDVYCKKVEVKQEIKEGDLISVITQDVTGYCYPVPYRVNKIERDRISITPIEMIHCVKIK